VVTELALDGIADRIDRELLDGVLKRTRHRAAGKLT
jgi:hypothetical protein